MQNIEGLSDLYTQPRQIHMVDVPPLDPRKISSLTEEDFSEESLRKGLTERLRTAAVFIRPLFDTSDDHSTSQRYVVGLQKTRPYANPYDLMLLVVGEGEIVRSISDLTEKEFTKLLRVGSRVLGLYQEHAKQTGNTSEQLAFRAISVNYDDCIDTYPTQYPRSAQSIPALHLHVVGITEREVASLKQKKFKEIFSSRAEEFSDREHKLQYYARYHDPLLFLIRKAIKIPAFRDGLMKNVTISSGNELKLTREAGYAGINFRYKGVSFDNDVLAQNIQTLIANTKELFYEFYGYAEGMGVGREDVTEAEQMNTLDLFAKRYRHTCKKLRDLKSYQQVESFLLHWPTHKLFAHMRNRFAYTLSFIYKNGDESCVVDIATVGASEGNLLMLFRMDRVVNPSLSPDDVMNRLVNVRQFLKTRF